MRFLQGLLLTATMLLAVYSCTKNEDDSETSSDSNFPSASFSDENSSTMKLTASSSTALVSVASYETYNFYPVDSSALVYSPVTVDATTAQASIDRTFAYIVTGTIAGNERCVGFITPFTFDAGSLVLNRENIALCYLALTALLDDDAAAAVFSNPHVFVAFVMKAVANKIRSGDYPVNILYFADELYSKFLERKATLENDTTGITSAVAMLYNDSIAETVRDQSGYDLALDELMIDYSVSSATTDSREEGLKEYAQSSMSKDPEAFKEDYKAFVFDQLAEYAESLTTQQLENFEELQSVYVATVLQEIDSYGDSYDTSVDTDLLDPSSFESGEFSTVYGGLDETSPIDTSTYFDSESESYSDTSIEFYDPCNDFFSDTVTDTSSGTSSDVDTDSSTMLSLNDPCADSGSSGGGTSTTSGPRDAPGFGGGLVTQVIQAPPFPPLDGSDGGAGGSTGGSGSQCKPSGGLGCSSNSDCCGTLVCCFNSGIGRTGGSDFNVCGEERIKLFGIRSCK